MPDTSVGPIASIFWRNEEFATGLGQDIALDGVVCVVDAVFGKQVMPDYLCHYRRFDCLAANGRRPLNRFVKDRREPSVGITSLYYISSLRCPTQTNCRFRCRSLEQG